VTESSTCAAFLTPLRSLDALIAVFLCSEVLPVETLSRVFASGNSFSGARGDSASSNALCENAGEEH
jgi:hypothetical protein